ncbi:MAG: hypothetical protein PVF99_12855, partial [Desulfobacterales bacterium]
KTALLFSFGFSFILNKFFIDQIGVIKMGRVNHLTRPIFIPVWSLNVSEFLQLYEINSLLIATSLYHRNGILECWNAGHKGGNIPF